MLKISVVSCSNLSDVHAILGRTAQSSFKHPDEPFAFTDNRNPTGNFYLYRV
jgi:hypothetical protein